MKRYALVCKRQSSLKNAFTLIEVMVSVMIISVVIMALLEMKSNNSFMFASLKKQSDSVQYITLLIENKDYKTQNKKIKLDALIKEFNIDDKLRKKLKNIQANIVYKKIDTIDLSQAKDTGSSMVLEVSESLLKMDSASVKLYRVKIKN